jgi:hypothetical protein
MDFTVDITVRTTELLTDAQLEAVAELGGVASGEVGGDRVSTIFTQPALGVPSAVSNAVRRMRVALRANFYVVAIEVMTTEEQDRRLAGIGY